MSMSATGARLKSGKDILITPVPLYHVQGGVLGVTAAIFHGVPQVILRKFSASRFWSQVQIFTFIVHIFIRKDIL